MPGIPPLGIDHTTRPHDWPPLHLEEVRNVLSHFPFTAPAHQLLWHSRRPFSAAALIRLEDGEVLFLKRHDQKLRSPITLHTEHHFISHLAQHGVPLVLPYHTSQGCSLVSTGNAVYEAFPPIQGYDLYRDIPSWQPYKNIYHAQAAGGMLARFHRASTFYTRPERHDGLLLSGCQLLLTQDLPHALQEWIIQRPALAQFLGNKQDDTTILDALMPFHTPLQPLLLHVKPCWGHGDWHGSNLTWEGTEVCQVFDVGMSNLTCIPFDIAVALERSFIHWMAPNSPHPVHYAQIRAFLAGYTTERHLSSVEKALIRAFLPLAHVEFALSEITYYQDLLHDPDGAEIAYRTYLLGHAQWFLTQHGQALLHWLTQWEIAS